MVQGGGVPSPPTGMKIKATPCPPPPPGTQVPHMPNDTMLSTDYQTATQCPLVFRCAVCPPSSCASCNAPSLDKPMLTRTPPPPHTHHSWISCGTSQAYVPRQKPYAVHLQLHVRPEINQRGVISFHVHFSLAGRTRSE